MTRALLYTRVSQDRAGGRSVEEQEAEARLVCEREGWDVVEVVTDSVGASRHSKGRRTGWARARKIVAGGKVDVLVTWEASRAQRDLEAYAELRRLCVDAGVLWSYSGRTYDLADHDDRFRTGLDALMAEHEADETAHRVQRAMRSNAAKGRPHGRRLFGYQRLYDPSTGRLAGQEPDPAEAAVVRRVFDEYLAGRGVRTIAGRLNDDEIGTSTGARWSDAQIRRALVNPAYAARRVHRGEVIGAADWPPLVDPERFDRVQLRLAEKRTTATRQIRTANLLSAVGRCGRCGGKIHRGHDRNHRKTYLCKERFCVARDLVKLDAHVTTLVLERLSRPDVVDALHGAAPPPEIVEARMEVVQLRQRLDDAVAQYTSGSLTASTLSRVEADLLPRIAAAGATIKRGAIPLEIDLPPGAVDAWWDGLTAEQKREVVVALIVAVTILPTQRGRRPFDPDAITIDWRA